MLSNVAAVVFDGVAPFELGVLCEAWGVDRRAQGVPYTEFAVAAERRMAERTASAHWHRFAVTTVFLFPRAHARRDRRRGWTWCSRL